MHQIISLLASAALTIGLTGCIVPVIHKAGSEESACGILSKGVPTFIKIGETTRRQVLQGLGTPMGTAPDQSWLTYGCRVSQGGRGVWFGIPMGGGGGHHQNTETEVSTR